MDQASLVTEETGAGAELVREFHEYMPVEVAFWIKPTDESRWTLCNVSKKIHEQYFDLGYGEVLRLAQGLTSLYIDPFQIRLLPIEAPIAKADFQILERFPGHSPTRTRGEMMGISTIEMAYLYPASKGRKLIA